MTTLYTETGNMQTSTTTEMLLLMENTTLSTGINATLQCNCSTTSSKDATVNVSDASVEGIIL